jgi:hypothetical protein
MGVAEHITRLMDTRRMRVMRNARGGGWAGGGGRALEGWAEEVEDHDIVLAFDPVPSNLRDAHTPLEVADNLGLVQELRVAASNGLELDGNLLPSADVDAWLKTRGKFEQAGSDQMVYAWLRPYPEKCHRKIPALSFSSIEISSQHEAPRLQCWLRPPS